MVDKAEARVVKGVVEQFAVQGVIGSQCRYNDFKEFVQYMHVMSDDVQERLDGCYSWLD